MLCKPGVWFKGECFKAVALAFAFGRGVTRFLGSVCWCFVCDCLEVHPFLMSAWCTLYKLIVRAAICVMSLSVHTATMPSASDCYSGGSMNVWSWCLCAHSAFNVGSPPCKPVLSVEAIEVFRPRFNPACWNCWCNFALRCFSSSVSATGAMCFSSSNGTNWKGASPALNLQCALSHWNEWTHHR